MKNSNRLCSVLSVGILAALSFGAAGCLPSLNDPARGPLNHTFVVSDYFSPSGFMGDGAKQGFMSLEVNQNCKQPRPPGAQGYCYNFTYYMDPNTNGYWGGVYWVFPANSWGARPGFAFDPTVFKQVHFYGAIDTPAINTTMGGAPAHFNALVGNINDGENYGPACTAAQEAVNAVGCEYDDETGGETTVQIGTDLTSELKEFTIIPKDLGQGDVPTDLVGGFAWSMEFPTDSCTCSTQVTSIGDCKPPTGVLTCPTPVHVYIDDIIWDTTPLPTPPDAGTPPAAGTPPDAGTQ